MSIHKADSIRKQAFQDRRMHLDELHSQLIFVARKLTCSTANKLQSHLCLRTLDLSVSPIGPPKLDMARRISLAYQPSGDRIPSYSRTHIGLSEQLCMCAYLGLQRRHDPYHVDTAVLRERAGDHFQGLPHRLVRILHASTEELSRYLK